MGRLRIFSCTAEPLSWAQTISLTSRMSHGELSSCVFPKEFLGLPLMAAHSLVTPCCPSSVCRNNNNYMYQNSCNEVMRLIKRFENFVHGPIASAMAVLWPPFRTVEGSCHTIEGHDPSTVPSYAFGFIQKIRKKKNGSMLHRSPSIRKGFPQEHWSDAAYALPYRLCTSVHEALAWHCYIIKP